MSKVLPKARLLLIMLLFSAFSLQSQIRIASPYSRFGIGDITGNNNAWNSSMGGIGAGLRSPYHINISNPASYTAFDSTSFLFEGGLVGSQVRLESNLQSSTRSHGSLGYLMFGFPVFKWWRTSLGLTPFSEVGYHIATLDDIPVVGRVTRTYLGEGGINRLYWGNAVALTKNISIGINAEYLFGNMTRESMVIFPDSMFFANMKSENDLTISSFHFVYGIQTRFKINKDVNLITGATFAAETQMKATTISLARTFFLSTAGIEYYKDTVSYSPGKEGKIILPMIASLGFSFEKPDAWIAGADVKWQNWEKFSAFGISDSLVNSLMVNAGIEFVPDINSYTGYLKKVRYRVGFMYNSTNLKMRGQHLSEYGLSLGLGLPLRGSKTALNLGAQIGTRGTTEAGLIKETYFRFVLGFSIYEKWFIKRKYY